MRARITFPPRRIVLLLIFSLLAALLLLPMYFKPGYPDTLDFSNHLAGIVEARIAMGQGQFLLRVAPLDHLGWSYPYYQFYSTTSYAIAGLIYAWITPSNSASAYWVLTWLAMLAGGIYMYLLAYWLVKSRPAAVMSSVVFLASPYYYILNYHISDLTEAVALGMLPAVLYYTLRCYQHPEKIRILLQVSLAWYLLATTHIITFMYTSLFVALLLVLITAKNFSRWRNLLRVGVAYLFGCVLASWFLAPIILYKDYLNVSSNYGDIRDFYFYRSSLANILYPWRNVSHGMLGRHSIHIDSITPVHANLGIPLMFAAAVCTYAVFRKSKLQNARADYLLPSLLFLFFLVIVMVCLPGSSWEYLPKVLRVCQYSWRLLAQAAWIGALLFAWAICWLFNNKLDSRHAVVGISLIILATSSWISTPERNYRQLDLGLLQSNPQIVWNTRSNLMNPKKSKNLMMNDLIPANEKLDPKQTQLNCQEENSSKVCELEIFPPLKIVELPILYYPDNLLEITVSGKKLEYFGVNYGNYIVAAIKPPMGVHRIKIEFRGLSWANYTSFLAGGLWLVLFLFVAVKAIYSNFSQTYPKISGKIRGF